MPLVAAIILPLVLVMVAENLHHLAGMYAIGVVGAITVNLGSACFNKRLGLNWTERSVMLVTFAVLVFGPAYHRLVAGGAMSIRVIHVISAAIEAASWPLALALSLDLFIAIAKLAGFPIALAGGVGGLARVRAENTTCQVS